MAITCYGAQSAKSRLEKMSCDEAQLGPHDIKVAITHCGICHSDIHLIDNDWKLSHYPLIPGHEIIGHIEEVGSLVDEHNISDRVGIGWQRSSCMTCEFCHRAEENLCLKQEATCVNHQGGFATHIIADGRFAFSIPEHLTSENAAPLLCGGATVYSPFIEHQVKPTDRVGIIGIGGLGHLAIQFAKAFGCEVTALSHSPKKEKEALKLGAHHFLASDNKGALKKLFNQFDFLLCTIAAPLDWEFYLNLLRPKGTLCFVGAQSAPISVTAFSLINGRKNISASNIASRPDLKDMLRFAALHDIKAQIELFNLDQVNEALEKVRQGQVRYRAVLKCS